jgi:hypothetical protein
MIASQDSHRERGEAPPKASIPRLGKISSEIDLPIPQNEDTNTVDDPDGTGLSGEFHSSPPSIGDGEVPVRYSLGGSYAEIRLRERMGAPTQLLHSRGRGRRSKIESFSPGSRLRLRRTLAPIPRDSKALFVTFTFPKDFSIDPETAKRLLENWRKRFERKYGEHAVVWKLEFRDGTLHFHLLIFFDRHLAISKARMAEIREWVAHSWWDVCGRTSVTHLEVGTRVERPRSLPRTMMYVSKGERLLGDTSSSSDAPPPYAGRRWGVLRRNLLPVVWVETHVSLKDGFQIRRILRKLLGLKNRAGVVTFRVFVRDEHVKRLLTLFGHPALR